VLAHRTAGGPIDTVLQHIRKTKRIFALTLTKQFCVRPISCGSRLVL
jgi:hypothetical protein